MANPTGKGGFKDHPENVNKEGRPTEDKSWAGSIRRLTNMTQEEAIKYVGAKTRLGRLLKELPPSIPIKDALILSYIIQFGREPNGSMLNALADREDGKPNQPITGANGDPLIPKPEQMKPSEIAERVAALLKVKDVTGS